MGKFDMKSFAATLGMVPESGIKQIEYIDIDMLHEDPRNFYEVSGVDELASNIALFGLMDPLLVRNAEDGTVQIVSGHRRHAALRKLVEEGHEDLRQVPCIRVESESSPALQELRLIYANSDTRKMTNADIGKQAERVEQLLYQLKEEGHEFPGRMRDHVAEACKISKSKLSRLHAIQNNLASDILKKYWTGNKDKDLSESAAYELAQLPEGYQRLIVEEYCKQSYNKNFGCVYLSAGLISCIAERIEKIESMQCGDGVACSHIPAMIIYATKALVKDRWAHIPCGEKCCGDCRLLISCKSACPHFTEEQKELKSAERERSRIERERRIAEERPSIDLIKAIWARFGSQRCSVGLSPAEYLDKINCTYSRIADRFEDLEAGTASVSTETLLPFGYNVTLSDVNRWTRAADLLGCSVDYLMMRTDDPGGAAAPSDAAPKWHEGQLPTSGLYFVKLRLDDNFVIKEVLWYDNVLEEFSFHGNRAKVEGEVLGWYPLPCGLRNGEVEEDAEDR